MPSPESGSTPDWPHFTWRGLAPRCTANHVYICLDALGHDQEFLRHDEKRGGVWLGRDRQMSVKSNTLRRLHRQLRGTMKFDDIKSDSLNLRVSPSFKRALKTAADHEQRSMVNMLEVLVANYCEINHIPIPSKSEREVHAVGKSQARAAL